MIKKLNVWWKQLLCAHPEWALEDRLLWIEEIADFYEKCKLCGKEFHN